MNMEVCYADDYFTERNKSPKGKLKIQKNRAEFKIQKTGQNLK